MRRTERQDESALARANKPAILGIKGNVAGAVSVLRHVPRATQRRLSRCAVCSLLLPAVSGLHAHLVRLCLLPASSQLADSRKATGSGLVADEREALARRGLQRGSLRSLQVLRLRTDTVGLVRRAWSRRDGPSLGLHPARVLQCCLISMIKFAERDIALPFRIPCANLEARRAELPLNYLDALPTAHGAWSWLQSEPPFFCFALYLL